MKSQVSTKGFEWTIEVSNEDGSIASSETHWNLIPFDGLNFLIRSPFGDVAAIPTFYLGLFRGNYIPSGGTKASDIPTNMIEFVDYSEASRPTWEKVLTGVSTFDNNLNKAGFTVTADRTVYGAFLVSDSVKGGNNGLVLSCVRFASPKALSVGQTVKLYGGITFSSSNII